MAKPQRALWELSNLLATHYGQPLEPEPDGGFAEENYPPRFFEVLEWFRDGCRSDAEGDPCRSPKSQGSQGSSMNGKNSCDALATLRRREATTTLVHDLQFAVEKLELTRVTAGSPGVGLHRRRSSTGCNVSLICGTPLGSQAPTSDRRRRKGRIHSGIIGPGD